MLALEATWEINQLNAMIRELCEDHLPRDEMSGRLSLRVRGLTSRIDDLVGVAMAVLDEDDYTENLSRRVHGVREMRRAAAMNGTDFRAASAPVGVEGNRNEH